MRAADPYGSFRQGFALTFGRGPTADELRSNEFLGELSNELFRLLPLDRLARFSPERLALLSNEDLAPVLRRNPRALSGFAPDRLAGFDVPTLRRMAGQLDVLGVNPELAAALRTAITGAGGTAPVPSGSWAGGAQQLRGTYQRLAPSLRKVDLVSRVLGQGYGVAGGLFEAPLLAELLGVPVDEATPTVPTKPPPFAESPLAKLMREARPQSSWTGGVADRRGFWG